MDRMPTMSLSGSEPRAPLPALIQIEGLQKHYRTRSGDSVQALGPIDLTIDRGEFITVVGPSGCGKSTLLKMLAGLIPRTSGTIRVNGQAIDGPQRDIGVVFQSPVLLPWKTTFENVMLPATVLKLDRQTTGARARQLLEMVGLADFAHRYPNELSGGMQQRVAIARALVHDPAVLLMDEPFGALDAMTRETMNVEIRRIWRESGKTVLFVTHSIPEAVFLGSRVLVLSSRPGCIAEIVDVELPAQRDLDVMTTERFGSYTRRIRHHFQAKGFIE
jgi:NitT/TauT family transport system ATP-binding protein